MNNLKLEYPSKVEFGTGSIGNLPAYLLADGRKRVLLLCDIAVAHHFPSKNVLAKLTGIDVKILPGPCHEPTYSDLDVVLATCNDFTPDCIVGVGGGTVMDLAKIAAVLTDKNTRVEDILGSGKVEQRSIGLYLVPTTSGTGSEATIRAIISDPHTGDKKAVESSALMADAVFLDPQLTFTVPSDVTASTGMDALVHCIEAFINRHSHPLIDMYALKGVDLISHNLAAAVATGRQLGPREALMLGSFYGGLCLGPVNTAAIHALAYPLGGKFHVPHGAANALLLPYVMDFNMPACEEKMAKLAKILRESPSCNDTGTVAEYIQNLCNTCGIRTRMSDFGIAQTDIPQLAESAMRITRLLKNNPRTVTYDDALNIYEAAL